MPFSSMLERSQLAYNGTVRVMCHKETNTDWSAHLASGSDDQSHSQQPDTAGGGQSRSDGDGSHSSSIRRWQTFSPPGITEDSYVCKVSVDRQCIGQYLFSHPVICGPYMFILTVLS